MAARAPDCRGSISYRCAPRRAKRKTWSVAWLEPGGRVTGRQHGIGRWCLYRVHTNTEGKRHGLPSVTVGQVTRPRQQRLGFAQTLPKGSGFRPLSRRNVLEDLEAITR
jgi:hypothetical protein